LPIAGADDSPRRVVHESGARFQNWIIKKRKPEAVDPLLPYQQRRGPEHYISVILK
jgi:hypothetical protein